MDQLLAIAPLLALTLAVINTAYTIHSNSQKAKKERVDSIAAEVQGLQFRMTQMEGEVRHLPDRETVHRMEIGLSELRGDMKAMMERITPVSAIAERLQEHMLEQKK